MSPSFAGPQLNQHRPRAITMLLAELVGTCSCLATNNRRGDRDTDDSCGFD